MQDTNARGAVIWFSMSGHSERVAEEVAERTHADTFRLEIKKYRHTAWGYARAGFDSLTGRLPDVSLPDGLSCYEWVAVGGPIWTSYPATPLRSLFSSQIALPARIGVFLTSGDVSPPEKAFAMCEQLLGCPVEIRLSLPNSIEGTEEGTARIARFCDALSEPALAVVR
ncbi:MAG: hypothetical protein AAFY59_17100 [Pseudomonadota bacterium]